MADPNSILEPSFCDGIPRPKGVGYVPPPGSISHLYSLDNGRGVHGQHTMDLSSHGFGDIHLYSMERQRLRYGPNFHGADFTQPRFLIIDFESLFGLGSIYLSKLACENKFGTAKTLSCYPTLEELHDYYAVNPDEGFKALGLSGAVSTNPPGIPIIISSNSTLPGTIKVVLEAAKTKGHTSYQLGIWSNYDNLSNGNPPNYITQVRTDGIASPGKERKELEATGLSKGTYWVRVRSLIGGSVGRWSSTTHKIDVKEDSNKPVTPVNPNPVDPNPNHPNPNPEDPKDIEIRILRERLTESQNKLASTIESYNNLSNKIKDAINEMNLYVGRLNKN